MNSVHPFAIFGVLSNNHLANYRHSRNCASKSLQLKLNYWRKLLSNSASPLQSFLEDRSKSSLCLVRLFCGMNEFPLPCSFRRLCNIFFFLEIFSLRHGTRMDVWVITLQYDCVLISRSLVVRRFVRDVNRVEVIKIFAMSFTPSCCHSGFFASFIVVPSVQD